MTSHTPNLINDVHIVHCSIILLSNNQLEAHEGSGHSQIKYTVMVYAKRTA